MLRSESEDDMEDIVNTLVFEKTAHSAYIFGIKDTEHVNFWDFPLFFGVYKYIGYWGPLDAMRLLDIEHASVTGFFDKYLKDADTDLSGLAGQFPEVTTINVKEP